MFKSPEAISRAPICNGINKGIIDKSTIIEILTGFKRAGANAVITYFANKIAKELK